MTWKLAALMLAGIACASVSSGQDDQAKPFVPQLRFYRLEFVVKEFESDKVINSRAYTATVAANIRDNSAASIRAGSRIPYSTSRGEAPGTMVSTQFNFYDIGVNIDSREARELPSGQLTLNVSVDISSLIIAKEQTGSLPPAVRNTKWSSLVVIPVKRPTTIFSSDDPSGNRKMQLELTATPIT